MHLFNFNMNFILKILCIFWLASDTILSEKNVCSEGENCANKNEDELLSDGVNLYSKGENEHKRK